MAGGTFVSFNKIRPGVYIDFKAAKREQNLIGVRGTVALPVALDWGAEGALIPLTVDEFVSGESSNKVGVSLQDQTETAQILREAFKGATKALLYRINKGGVKATATVSTGVTAAATSAGTAGNDISVVVIDNGTDFTVETLYKDAVKDTQYIETVADFKANAYITLNGTGTLAENPGIALTGGSSGTASDANYTEFFDLLTVEQWNTAAILSDGANDDAIAFVKDMREKEGRYVQIVVNDATDPDYEGVINTAGQGYVLNSGERIEPNVFVAWVAGATAGAQINQSTTYRVIDGAVSIINPLKNTEIETALQEGYFVLSQRSDGAIVVEDDINSLVTYTDDKSPDWHRNRVVRTIDDIATQTRKIFEKSYIGKVDNNDSGRTILKTHLIDLFNQAQRINAIQNFDSSTDVVILPGADINSVIANLGVQPVDSMTKLYATLTLR